MKKTKRTLMVVVDYTPFEALNEILEDVYTEHFHKIGADICVLLDKNDENNEQSEEKLLYHMAVSDEVWYFFYNQPTEVMKDAIAMGLAAREKLGTKIALYHFKAGLQ